MFMEEYYCVACSICNGVSAKEVNKKLRETIFDRMDKKLAVQVDIIWRNKLWWM